MRYEVFTLGKHYLQISTNKGFTLFANAKLDTNGKVVSYTDKMVRRGGTWVIDTWKFLTVKYFPENPIYCAVFGFADDDNEVHVTATDIDVDSISGVNGQLVDIGNISLPENQSLPVNLYGGDDVETVILSFDESGNIENFDFEGVQDYDVEGMFFYADAGTDSYVNANLKKVIRHSNSGTSYSDFSYWGSDNAHSFYYIIVLNSAFGGFVKVTVENNILKGTKLVRVVKKGKKVYRLVY